MDSRLKSAQIEKMSQSELSKRFEPIASTLDWNRKVCPNCNSDKDVAPSCKCNQAHSRCYACTLNWKWCEQHMHWIFSAGRSSTHLKCARRVTAEGAPDCWILVSPYENVDDDFVSRHVEGPIFNQDDLREAEWRLPDAKLYKVVIPEGMEEFVRTNPAWQSTKGVPMKAIFLQVNLGPGNGGDEDHDGFVGPFSNHFAACRWIGQQEDGSDWDGYEPVWISGSYTPRAAQTRARKRQRQQ